MRCPVLYMLTLSTLSLGRSVLAPPSALLSRTRAPRVLMAAKRKVGGTADLTSLTIADLKAELVQRGLPVSGKKSVLIERLNKQMRPSKLAFGSSSSSSSSVAGSKRSSSSSSTARSAAGAARNNGALAVERSDGPAVMIVESPAKCATISKFVGKDYVVLASYGHVRPGENFAMDFELTNGARRVLTSLGGALQGSRALLLATDPDREGEAIAWHLHEALREKGLLPEHVPVKRISFSEITQKAVQAALAAPREIDMPLVRAQQARQAVDYLVGFTLSPVLWRKLPGCKSAGRVQSVALRIITEREHAIAAFVPQEYWTIKARLLPPADGDVAEAAAASLLAEITHLNGAKLRQFDLGSHADTAAASAVLPEAWVVTQVKRSQRQSGPPAPYNTASLQQDASRKLGMAVGRVMRLAQSLYEGVPLGGGDERVALITYMRTDGIQMSADGVAAARAYIRKAFGGGTEWLPASPREFKKKARNAQEAHEAIRPVDMQRTPASLKGKVDDAELRLYEVIWRRAVASQMANALHEQLAITMRPEEEAASGEDGDAPPAAEARATGSRQLRPGFKVLSQQPSAVPPRSRAEDGEDDEEDKSGGKEAAAATPDTDRLNPLLQNLSEGDVLHTAELLPAQHFTEPPPRFSEGSLVSHLEALGIGRPSTYASILKSLQERGYCTMISKTLRPQQRGQLVTALLTSEELEQYVQTDFTARLEAQLDAISAGELEQLPFLAKWYSQFRTAVQSVEQADTMRLREEVADKCAWTLFPSSGAVPPPPVGGAVAAEASPAASAAASPAPSRRAAEADVAEGEKPPMACWPFHAASGEAEGGAPSVPRPERVCPSCGVGQMSLKFSRFGPFVGCSEYPSCGWSTRPREPWAAADAQPTIDKLALGVLSDGALPELGELSYAGLEVSVRDGPVGWYVQLGGNVTHEQLQLTPPPDVKALKVVQLKEELTKRGLDATGRKADLAQRLLQAADLRGLVPHKRVSLPEGTNASALTMNMAKRLLSLPRVLGRHPEHGTELMLHTGRFGPYVSMDVPVHAPTEAESAPAEEAAGDASGDASAAPAVRTALCSLPKRVSFWEVDAAEAVALIDAKMVRDAKRRGAGKPPGRKKAGTATAKARAGKAGAKPRKKKAQPVG